MKIKNADFALLLLRVSIGVTVAAANGFMKIKGGPDLWGKLGGSMSNLGITFWPVFWGFMSAFAEFFCSILVAAGFLTRAASFILAFNMFVAFYQHIHNGDSFSKASGALELMFVFIVILLMGAGKYSLDSKIKVSGLLQ